MSKFVLVLCLLAVTSFSIPINTEELQSLWSSWKSYHSKSFSQGEEAARFSIFVENYKKVIDFNSKNTGVKLGLNKFADLTAEEFKYLYASGHVPEQSGYDGSYKTSQDLVIELPDSVDWRTKGAVAPVQDQGQCGACWVFSAMGSLESLYFLKTGSMVVFSDQQVIDCAPKSEGCNEGSMSKAFVYTASKGIEPESDYPYIANVGTCEYNASLAIKVNTGFEWLPFKDANALKTAVVKQPVSVIIEADQEVFQLYTSGVITSNCGADVDHSVLVVGYETINGQEAYIVQNSWGNTWGINGYVYISTDSTANNGNGVCGILNSPIIPV